MKKKEIFARYSELASNREVIASTSIEALMKLATSRELEEVDLSYVHAAILNATLKDEENDQREIANLIAVANSDAFSQDTRATAVDRVIMMLELG